MTAPAPPLELQGPTAPPRANGELVFAEPWESRAFGIAVSLSSAGAFTWKDFSTRLAESIARWERSHEPGEEYSYYRCWLEALEALLDERGVLGRGEVLDRAARLTERPEGHDHRHEH